MWQDYVFAVGALILWACTVPMIRDRQKPPIKTSVVTAAVLVSYAVAEWTIDLTMAAVVTSLQVVGWAVLGYQRWKQGSPRDQDEWAKECRHYGIDDCKECD